MKADLYVVTFIWNGRLKTKELEPLFSQGIDWARYSVNCWLLLTTSSLGVWAQRIKPVLGPTDHYIMYKIDMPNYSGWAPAWIDTWIKAPNKSSWDYPSGR